MNLISNILKVSLVAIGVLSCLFLFTGPNATADLETITEFREGGRLSFSVGFTIFTIVACVALVLLFFVVQLISNPKKTLFSIIGIVVALVLYLVISIFGTTDTNESLQLLEDVQVAQSSIDATTAGIYTVLIGLVVALLAAVFGPIISRLSK